MLRHAPLLARAAARPAPAALPSTPSRMLSLYTRARLMRGPAFPSRILRMTSGRPGGVFQTRAHTAGPSNPPPSPPSSAPPPPSASSKQSSRSQDSGMWILIESLGGLLVTLFWIGLWLSLLGVWRGYVQAFADTSAFLAALYHRSWDWLVGPKTMLYAVEALQRNHARLQQQHESTEKELKALRGTLEEVARLAADVDALQEKGKQVGEELQAVATLGVDATALMLKGISADDMAGENSQAAPRNTIGTLAALVQSVKKTSLDQSDLSNKMVGIQEDAQKQTRDIVKLRFEVSKIRWAALDADKLLTDLRQELADVKGQHALTKEEYAQVKALEKKLDDLLKKGQLV